MAGRSGFDDSFVGGVPAGLIATVSGRGGDPRALGGAVDGDTWLARLPRLVSDLGQEWELRPDGDAAAGSLSLALRVTTAEGEEAVLKVAWPNPATAHEHLALRLWGESHAVRLLRADPGRNAQLLERAGPDDLYSLDVEAACAVIGEKLAHLRAPARPPFVTLSDEARRWARELREATPMDAAFPQRFRLQAASLAADLASDCGDDTLVHADLHYRNVLASRREGQPGWLAIDPDPLLGEPEACLAPALWNRIDPADAGGALAWDLSNRIEILCAPGELDPERARAWSLVRVVAGALDEFRHPTGAPHRNLTLRVRLAKALQRP